MQDALYPLENMPAQVTVSIVSHGQAGLLKDLLQDFRAHCCSARTQIVLTINVPEPLPFDVKEFGVSRVIRNDRPRGFAANHNAAFRYAEAPHFCVLNPDIRFDHDPFPPLLEQLTDPAVGVVGPLVLSPGGAVEDSARRFPTLATILQKAMGVPQALDYDVGDVPIHPDWLAGMFLLFRSQTFREAGGFDERYFLYYEDVDLCARLRIAGYDIRLVPASRVVHFARRESRRRLAHFSRHVRSLCRFLWTSSRRTGSLSG